MKTFTKQLGVTLLEVMLVLAVAAMIIVMSIRYYQSAAANQQTNSVLQLAQGIAAAADSLAQRNGSYDPGTNTDMSEANIQALLPSNSLNTPWGVPATVTNFTATGYDVNLPQTPAPVCIQVVTRLATNPNFTNIVPANAAACPTSGNVNVSYTYSSVQ
jgi:Tfp pilus assembly major pilin PilA